MKTLSKEKRDRLIQESIEINKMLATSRPSIDNFITINPTQMRERHETEKIKFINNKSVNMNGSSLVGFIETTYGELCAMFGTPTFERSKGHDLDKVNSEWLLSFTRNGKATKASIYDWKQSNYRHPTTPLGLYRWHIGGFNTDAVLIIQDFIKENL